MRTLTKQQVDETYADPAKIVLVRYPLSIDDALDYDAAWQGRLGRHVDGIMMRKVSEDYFLLTALGLWAQETNAYCPN